MAGVDISEGARELVDISAEAVGTLGDHLQQIGELIAASTNPPIPGAPRSTAKKVFDKLEMYKAYCEDVKRRKAEIERKQAADVERMTQWRKECGTEGATLVDQLDALYAKVREQRLMIEERDKTIEEEKEKVANLEEKVRQKDQKLYELGCAVIDKKDLLRNERSLRAGFCAALQCSFDNIKFKFKADQERERLKIEHQKRLRKACCERRLKGIDKERTRRILQQCLLAIQEETVEGRAYRQLEIIRRRYEDHVLILEAQLAQALGDEEKAKALIAEQVRRMEEAKRAAREAEMAMKAAMKDAKAARLERDKALTERDEANRLKDEAIEARIRAEEDAAEARADAAEAKRLKEVYFADKLKAEQAQRDLEDLVRKKNKKIKSLKRMLAEIGAESDSDMPPDERPPAFFVNEDGSKAPRPRTRKERMCMAYREAESARFELRLGMAAMVDKEVKNQEHHERLLQDLSTSQQEIKEVRWANKVLNKDVEAAVAAARRQAICPVCENRLVTDDGEQDGGADRGRPASAQDAGIHAPLRGPPQTPLAVSMNAQPPWSPMRPVFVPAPGEPAGSPRLLVKTASQPLLMPSLCPPSPEPLAPLRSLKRPPLEWRAGWK